MTDSAPKSRLPRTGTLVLIALVLLIGGGALMVWVPYHRNQSALRSSNGLAERTIQESFVLLDSRCMDDRVFVGVREE